MFEPSPATAIRILVIALATLAVPATAQDNLLDNPDFDVDLAGWGAADSEVADIDWVPIDAAGNPSSGSLQARNTRRSAGGTVFVGGQCVDVMPGETYTFGGSVFAESGQTFRGVFFQMLFRPLPDCGGSTLEVGAASSGQSVLDAWVPASAAVVAPSGAVSATFRFAVSRASADPIDDVEVLIDRLFVIPGEATACAENLHTACIGDRFQITVDYATVQDGGSSGRAVGVPLSTLGFDRGAVFWFFSPANPELLIKVLDTCGFSDHFWVFYSAGTNVGFEIRILDLETGAVWTSTNPDVNPAPPVQDLTAFSCDA